MGSLRSLLCRQNFTETWREIVESEGGVDMPVQRHAVELGEHVDAANAGVETITYWDIDKPVLATKRHSRLGPFFCKREQSGAGSSTHDNGHRAVCWGDQGNIAHRD
jgi:hypothetical protein